MPSSLLSLALLQSTPLVAQAGPGVVRQGDPLPSPIPPATGESIEGVWLLALIGIIIAVVSVRAVRERRRRRAEPTEGPFLVFPGAPPVAAAPLPPPSPPPPPYQAPLPYQAPPTDEASETIRFDPALEGTVQLLPGRLVVVSGAEVGREYRFLRPLGETVPEVTVGRAPGPSGRHLQLSMPTVSRLHARLSFRDRRWTVANVSPTNPVRVNGRELDGDARVVLSDGDRIQLGEVELRYLESPA